MAGTLTISTLSDGTNSTSATNPIKGSAKAWANFSGSATPTINNSFNISSITYTSAGFWTVNFTTAMTNIYYVVSFGQGGNSTYNAVSNLSNTQNTTSFSMYHYENNSAVNLASGANIAFAVFGS